MSRPSASIRGVAPRCTPGDPLILLAVLLGLAACGESSSERGRGAATATSSTVVAAPPSASGPPGHAYADDDLPVPADFADAMEEDITRDNYKDKLKAVQREFDLAGPPPSAPGSAK